ncbi:hypothetical protein IC582_029363 [Cucumis melo]|uniref:Uncharacterized protein n=3 Tax=Cucumis melo TaxID=3656 RepID=A0A5D3DRV1_CUCMM|nr:uncharacterized protein LOC103486438 [Cucumis melo]KAA0056993.1 uncharacterized protein E6C27_scaffold96G001740 [Cucumis melo var. makuwa]TYK26421.1 uncharacterized protein E5676_scaffold861G00850 [Cucumis melo var. makuwa]
MAGRNFPGIEVSSFSDMVFGFLDDGEGWPAEGFGSSLESDTTGFDENDEEKENGESLEESKSFWETQIQILQGMICRSNSAESKIRNATKEAVKEIERSGGGCACGRSVLAMTGCRSCMMREVSGRLRNAGYDSAVCKTKWKSSQHIPSGEHTFLDVVQRNTKKGEVRLIIELNLRAEFEMARGSEEYNRLVRRLPEIFVGKVEKLQGVIKVICGAAKKCMKEKKMHLGPWRKQRYMQAKWLSPCERTMSMPLVPSSRLPKPKASMLTVDFLDKLPNRTALEVV